MKVFVTREWAELIVDRLPVDPAKPLPSRLFKLTPRGRLILEEHRKKK